MECKWQTPFGSRLKSHLEATRRPAEQVMLMHHRTCSKSELQVEDRVLDSVVAAWGKWWRITLAILRLVWKRTYFGVSGNQLKPLRLSEKPGSFKVQRPSDFRVNR